MKESLFNNISPKTEKNDNKKKSSQKGITRRELLIGAGALTATTFIGKKTLNVIEKNIDEKHINEKLEEVEERIAARNLSEATQEQVIITEDENEVIGKTFSEQIASGEPITLDESTRKAIYTHWYKKYSPGEFNYEKGLLTGIERMQPWIAEIKEVFRAHDIPENEKLVYLAIAESHFTIDAVSKKSAVGPYQITKKTARLDRFNLTVNTTWDERIDPIKSAELCAKHLKMSYEQFGHDWNMALMDYNGGFTNLYQKQLITKEKNVPITVQPKNHLIKEDETLSSIAKKYNTSTTLLMRANKLTSDNVRELQIGQKLQIPQEREEITSEKFNTWLENRINNRIKKALNEPDHTVSAGETLGKIAQENNISIEILKAVNNLSSDVIRPGMPLTIPGRSKEMRKKQILKVLSDYKENINYPGKFHAIRDIIFEQELETKAPKLEKKYRYVDIPKMSPIYLEHTIKKGETIDKITKMVFEHLSQSYAPFEQSAAFIKRAIMHQNGITNEHEIKYNDSIKLTISTRRPATLLSIANRYDVDIATLEKLNPAVLSPTAYLPENKKIRIPL